jgi:hypothetical protein
VLVVGKRKDAQPSEDVVSADTHSH